MDDGLVRSLTVGLSQKGVRNHNERLLLTLVQRHGSLPASDLARLAGLSPPAVSGILRRLETEGLLERGEPTRGKVGKPSVPIRLAPQGTYAIGLKIGRRSADLLLQDFTGGIRQQVSISYDHPWPEAIIAFLKRGITTLTSDMTKQSIDRICGIGIAIPFELWRWHDTVNPTDQSGTSWKGFDFGGHIAQFSNLPVLVLNDATAACHAEQIYGRGKEFRDYAYFFVGTFVGGGIVLNHSVFEGRQSNAGALGSLRSIGPNGESMQLVDMASIHLLEARLKEVDLDPRLLWNDPQDWSRLARYVEPWLGQTAQELAKASLSTCSVIDFEAILIDGAFPPSVRKALVERVRRYLATQDTRGLIAPRIEEGSIGGNARAIGAACTPMLSQFFLNTNNGLMIT
ncbi:MAG: putative NBD/HSP70 family sugar kinase [Paracoccaceae bacterium]|jgi:predicted NBD/HSP70 family sugar kinase